MLFERVFIWGPNPFTNKLFASQVYGLSGIDPVCINKDEQINAHFFDDNCIVFCDCDKKPIDSYCNRLIKSSGINTHNPAIALMNVDRKVEVMQDFIRYPIRGVFYTSDDFENITKGIDKIIQGHYWVTRDLLVQSLEIMRNQKNGKQAVLEEPLITKREMEILQLIVAGFSNQHIADKLFISSNTVKTHVSNLYKKIGATNRVQAILWATENINQRQDIPNSMVSADLCPAESSIL